MRKKIKVRRIIIFAMGIYYLSAGCSGITNILHKDNQVNIIKRENADSKPSLDSLSDSYDSLLPNYTAVKNKPPDTVFVFNPVDSINWIDSIRYVVRDSVIISYEERTFPADSIIRYLNLFFRTDNVKDTAGLHFNFEVFDGNKLTYQRDTLYNVPDSNAGWRIEWWKEEQE